MTSKPLASVGEHRITRPYPVARPAKNNSLDLNDYYISNKAMTIRIGLSLCYIVKALAMVYREELENRTDNWPLLRVLAALRMVLAALRIMCFPIAILKLHSMKFLTKLYNPARTLDPLYFLSHRYYISKHLTLRQRMQVAMNHHEYEFKNYGREYAMQVYRLGGVLLWERSIYNHDFAIVLNASDDNRHEGDLSVILLVDKVRLCRMSFCYLDADIFGFTPHMTILISRNQTDRTSARALFDQCFKQNTPQLFCLAAVCGIAITNDFKTILAIKHDAQIAYEENFDLSFRNSYTVLWEKFGSIECRRDVYMLDVPLNLRPLQLVSRSHRDRAHNRRRHWDDILQSARSALIDYRIASKS